ncbi:MAG: SMP-30/gluconolactonase/LRE family protein [Planctomycetaceae bacterium]|nr:SMP-30/gluconolactonase/LRE family protein [Planctomycetaceae bacterium]
MRYLMPSVALTLFAASFALGADSIPGLGPIGEVKKLHGDFKFTEGPAADGKGNVFFSDIPDSTVYKTDVAGKLSVFRKPSGSTNGNMFNAVGELVGCEMEGRIVAVAADGKVRVIADKHEGNRFNAPNDLVLDRAGGVYFTDPHFRAPLPLPQKVTAVYYVDQASKVTRLVDDLKAPNGVILSPDEKTLYVIPSMQAEMMAYPVLGPGKLGAGKVFCTLAQPQGQQGRGGDGLTVDEKGNLYITSGLGLQVFDKDGKALGIIEFPEAPANVTFGGPENKTLFVTARTSLYTAEMSVKGHVFPGK